MPAASMTAGMRQLQSAMKRLGSKAKSAVEKGMTSAALRARVIMVEEAQAKRVMNTGYYVRAWKASKLPATYTVRVYNDSPYAAVVEKGRRAGARMPPVEPIARWAQRKFKLPYKIAKGIGFAIARNIQKRGIPGRNVLEDAKPKLQKMMTEEIEREILTALGTT